MSAFGELMMFAYYGSWCPPALRVRAGFYEHGLWMEGATSRTRALRARVA